MITLLTVSSQKTTNRFTRILRITLGILFAIRKEKLVKTLIGFVMMLLSGGLIYAMCYTAMVFFFGLDVRVSGFLTGGIVGIAHYVWGYTTGENKKTSDE